MNERRAGAHHCATCGECCTKLIDIGVRIGSAVLLRNVNLHMHCGELTVIIGPNGAGKTTLLRTILGEIPHSGRIEHRPRRRNGDAPLRTGYVPQRLDFDASAPMSVDDLFAGALSGRPVWTGISAGIRTRVRDALSVVAADHLHNRRVGTLSGGELQRVLLALALTPTPDLLLLDEPVSGVDPAGIELFYDMVSALRQRYDLSILLVSHDLEIAARYADRMVFLNTTILADSTPAEVLSHELVRKTFGVSYCEAIRHNAESGHASPHHHHVHEESVVS